MEVGPRRDVNSPSRTDVKPRLVVIIDSCKNLYLQRPSSLLHPHPHSSRWVPDSQAESPSSRPGVVRRGDESRSAGEERHGLCTVSRDGPVTDPTVDRSRTVFGGLGFRT